MSSAASFTTGAGLQNVHDAAITDIGQIYKSNVNLTLVDPGAITAGAALAGAGIAAANDALETIAHYTGEALTKITESTALESERNRQFAGQGAAMVVDAVNENTDQVLGIITAAGKKVLDFATTEGERNRQFAGQAVAAVSSSNSAALSAVASSNAAAIGAIERSADKAFTLVGGAFNALAEDHSASLAAISEHSVINMEFLNEQAARVANNATATLNGITAFVGDLFKSTDARNASIISNQAMYNAETVKVLGEATRSDAAKSMDTLVKTAGLAVMVIAGFAFFGRGK